jgi:hypothetical protein
MLRAPLSERFTLFENGCSLALVGITGSLGSGNPTVRAREKIKAR